MTTDEESSGMPECGDSIDLATFSQILEMDDDDDREFSKGIVLGFLEQAESTFGEMEESLEEKDLPTLSSLGHFLKGSSATIGLTHIMQSCEKIQHLGQGSDETGDHPETKEHCLKAISKELVKLKVEYSKVERALKAYYHE